MNRYYLHFPFQIGSCNSNTIGTPTPNILISYKTLQVEKIWWILNKEPSTTPSRAQQPLPENYYNDHNTKTKFWCHEIQTEFQGKTKEHNKNMGPNKGKGTFRNISNMTTFKFVKSCDCHNDITKSATLPYIWLLTYIWNLLPNKFKGTSSTYWH